MVLVELFAANAWWILIAYYIYLAFNKPAKETPEKTLLRGRSEDRLYTDAGLTPPRWQQQVAAYRATAGLPPSSPSHSKR